MPVPVPKLKLKALVNFPTGGGVPEAPSDNVKYTRRNAAWASTPNITVSTVAPGFPAVNDVWIDTN
jgi:hypothetical protein